MVKNLPARQETGLDPWIGKILWRREWQPALVFLPGESMDREVWWAIAHGVTRVRHDWAANTHPYFDHTPPWVQTTH